ncbi:Ssh1p KNAG_0C01660 [Huiozyma naganishii CBS 8797]|uniref:Translocon Sec61/SecY plug domain-containing protein n=1 Tax=Huiozyma naganishii (strain ATCC MYA-139 / BCRC 22969 / CBS 8797 / KCTC 17520 / NBRC 10181 / NCYC 3082 / Yp74L-3) TaxID=1071383 RepID=J7R371_HUIN7|nr:hypothetical protein KNAG_0C01660 [Kazachstania naganishii CBS 8797]CCK69280.1 hypothetical protein KNAG_0C01660 [Kazachstania naganishii CBS 8797]
MAGLRLIDLAKPIFTLLPEVEVPFEKIPFDDKVVYTIFSALIYLFAQFPLAGVKKDAADATIKDPIYFLRGVFAAEPRTLLEFGIFPIVSSGLILQLLAGLKVIKVNFKLQRDRELFQTLTKVFSLLQYFLLTNIFIASGYYGVDLTWVHIFLLNVQLNGAGLFASLLTEVIDKGFGFTSGPMIINTIVIATNLVADTLGVNQISVDAEGNTEPQGALINLFQGFRAKHKTFLGGIVSAFDRDYLPNLSTMAIVLCIGIIVCYLQSFRLELPIRSTKARGMNNVYPVRLFHIGCLSITFSYVLLFSIHIVAFAAIVLVGKNNPSSLVCKVLGHYEMVNNILAVPTFPLSMLTPPRSLIGGILSAPLSFIVYPLFVLTTGVWFAYRWQAISGGSARDLALDFKEQGITLTGRREQNIAKELEKVIPSASTTGAGLLALLTIAGELLGLKGKAAGMVVGVAGGFSLLEIISMDYQQTGGDSALSGVLGTPTNF